MFGRRKQGRAPQPVPATAAWPATPVEAARAEPAPVAQPSPPAAADVERVAHVEAPASAPRSDGAPSPVPDESRDEQATAPTAAGELPAAQDGLAPEHHGGPGPDVPADGDERQESEGRAATWAATWGIQAQGETATAELVESVETHDDSSDGRDDAATHDGADDHLNGAADAVEHASTLNPTAPVSRETGAGESLARPETPAPLADLDPEEQRRAALVESLPTATPDTPLMAELQLDARRRIELRGRQFPRPAETRVVTVANQKGGVGKTTTTVNLAAALAQSGLNVLVLDNDPQGNASTALGIEHRAGTPSIYEVLVEGAPIAEAVQESPDVPRLWCLPATIDLSGAEIELVSMVARETRLRSALDAYLQWRIDNGMERIDYVFVDCPPSLGLLTVNAFVVAREVLIPIQCEYYALEGLSQLLKTIQLIQAHLNPDLHVSTILLTMYDARTNLAQQVAAEVREHFPERTLRTTVPRSVRISEAPSYGQTVMTYDAGSSGALAYLEAAREIAERGAAAGTDTTPTSVTATSGTEEDR